jgi:Anti-sigma factor NepR
MWPSSNLRESNPFSEWTITADDADARIARAIRICVGDYVREMYNEALKEPIPPRIAKLLRRLDRQSERR